MIVESFCHTCPEHRSPMARVYGEGRYWCSAGGHYVSPEQAVAPEREHKMTHDFPRHDPEEQG